MNYQIQDIDLFDWTLHKCYFSAVGLSGQFFLHRKKSRDIRSGQLDFRVILHSRKMYRRSSIVALGVQVVGPF
jgi:hypothetical protein